MVCYSSGIVIGQNTSVGDSVNCIARTDLHYDWSFQIPVVNSPWHMILTELRSDWNVQIPFPGPRIVSIYTRPLFPRRGWGLGDETNACTASSLPRGGSRIFIRGILV